MRKKWVRNVVSNEIKKKMETETEVSTEWWVFKWKAISGLLAWSQRGARDGAKQCGWWWATRSNTMKHILILKSIQAQPFQAENQIISVWFLLSLSLSLFYSFSSVAVCIQNGCGQMSSALTRDYIRISSFFPYMHSSFCAWLRHSTSKHTYTYRKE